MFVERRCFVQFLAPVALWALLLLLLQPQNAIGHDDHHIQELLSSMTIEDRIGQMAQVDINDLCEDDPSEAGKKRLSQSRLQKVIGEHGVGSVFNYIQGTRPLTPREMREAAIQIQLVAKNYSRPPVLLGLDSVHGANYVHGAVVTPQPINLAATFNTTLALEAGKLSSRDTRAVGIQWLFAPLMGIALELKWPRVYETFGEDPFLVAQMGASFIRGIQAVDDNTQEGAGIPSKAAACAKHYIGYSASHNGHDRSPSWIPTRHLYQYFLQPWVAAIQQEEVLTVMESYTETDGVPQVGNSNTLQYLLRQRLGFKGVLVTDYEEILNLKNWHHISPSGTEAVVHSLRETSVDISMVPHDEMGYLHSVQTGISNGTLVEERINQSVERILHLKNALSMFHEEVVPDDISLSLIGQDSDKELALEMATQSIVLVKNDKQTLPVVSGEEEEGPKKVMVTGPTANSLVYQSGGWTGEWQGVPIDKANAYFTYGATVLEGIKSAFSAENVKYSCGVDILGNDCQDDLDDKPDDPNGGSVYGKFKDWAGLGSNEPSSSIEKAAALATSVDVVVICIGEESYTEKPGDIRSLELANGQYELVSFVKQNTNAKVVVVYFGGRPRLLRKIVDYADAILLAFLPGPSAGQAVADIIAGASNPSGKLPITYPMFEDGGGSPYFRTISDQCTKGDDNNPLPHYEYIPCEVQWPFGHGLSYTFFQYSQLSLSTKRILYNHAGKLAENEPFVVSVNVKNKGSMAGYETVFFFTFDEFRSTTPEYKRLRTFERVFLEPGEEKTISVSIAIEDLKFVGPHDDSHFVLENGLQFRVGVGAKTDCRTSGQESALCSDLLTIDAGDDYIGACDAACDLWASSGCSEQLHLSQKKCWKLCTSVSKNSDVITHLGEGEDGWGWNYVRCLESVVWGFQELGHTFDKSSQCDKMTALCRDIFRTDGNDSFGHGPRVQHIGNGSSQNPASVIVALLGGLIASGLVYYALRGGFQKKAGSRDGIQFTPVSNEDMLTA